MLSIGLEVLFVLAAVRDEFISQIIHAQTHQLKKDTKGQFTEHKFTTDESGLYITHTFTIITTIWYCAVYIGTLDITVT